MCIFLQENANWSERDRQKPKTRAISPNSYKLVIVLITI